jgi:GT2 family glycosyltransferase
VLRRNETPRGYLYCRNRMLGDCVADFAISLDDDANFLTGDPLAEIASHFAQNPNCGVAAFRIFWGAHPPVSDGSGAQPMQVKSFVGCGHAWRMESWKQLSGYPEWFGFYGEEQYASLQLFRLGWAVDYLPQVLVHHRVDMQQRKKNKTMRLIRARNALRADWFVFALSYPAGVFLRKLGASLRDQLVAAIRGSRPLQPVAKAFSDLVLRMPKIAAWRSPLTTSQYRRYQSLPPARIYWKPER